MISVEEQYLHVTRNILLVLGLWPYQQSRLAKLQYIFFFNILMLAILFHFVTFATTEFTPELLVKVLSSLSIFISFIIQYCAFRMNSVTIKALLEKLQRICDTVKNENEIAIIEKYGNFSNYCAFCFLCLIIFGSMFLFLIQFWPTIFDYVLPRNESRPLIGLFPIYFINQQKYFYYMVSYMTTTMCLGIFSITAIGALYLACQVCICALLNVSSYRMEHAIKDNASQSARVKNYLITERLIKAIEIHRNATKFSKVFLSTFETTLALSIIMGVVGLSLNLFCSFQIMMSECDLQELLLPLVIVFVITIYMFLANYCGQQITDHNSEIFITVYNIQWYKAPLNVQKLVLFLLQKGSKDFTLTVGGLITGSLQCFATLVNTSVSYFTVLYSTQT